MTFDPTVIVHAMPALIKGAGITLAICAIAIALSIVVAILLTIMAKAGIRPLSAFVRLYISFARGTPLFVQVLLIYYLLPVTGLDLPPFVAGFIALSLNSGAYGAEIIRGGLTAMPRGQVEAARAFAMPGHLIWRRIVLPQVLVLTIPPFTFEFAGLVKASALLSVIGVIELTRTGVQLVASTYRPVEIWVAVGVMYFLICFVLGSASRYIEMRTRAHRSV